MSSRLVLIALAVAACGRKAASSDCPDVLDDPAHAVANLSAKYPDQAVKVATIIEGCIAPGGTLCDRVVALVAKIPSMMPTAGPALTDPMTTCQQMPPALQSCLLPSYVLAHGPECATLRHETEVASIDIRPRVGPPPPGPDCPEVRVWLDPGEVGYGRNTRNVLLRQDKTLDFEGLERGLKNLAVKCPSLLSIIAAPEMTYQDIVSAMDVANKVGFSEIELETGDDTPLPPSLPTGDNAMMHASVLVITPTDVTVGGKVIAHPGGADVSGPVHDALAATPPDMRAVLIFQAEATLSARTVLQAVTGAHRAGFGAILFAVKH